MPEQQVAMSSPGWMPSGAKSPAIATHTGRVARGRPARVIATVTVALLVALVPLSLLAAGPFSDLDPASPHNDNIEAIRQAGITKGCNPPDFTQYCPKDNVTREEMAPFLARTASLGGNPPVAHALTAQMADTVADGAITPAKLSAAGSTAGQVLTSTAREVATWGSSPLPTLLIVTATEATGARHAAYAAGSRHGHLPSRA